MRLTRGRRAVLFVLLGTVLAVCVSFYVPISRRRLDPIPVISLRLEDRAGVLLREVLSDEGGRCRWVGLADISPSLLKATIAAEDRHFLTHSGVNPYAVVRAFVQNLRSRHVVSGASTITQQVVRNIYHFRRTVFAKAREAWLAVRLEHTLSKAEILVQYLNRISYGNQALGIEAAARLYFDKPATDLSLAESALLAIIPRAPSELNPYRNRAAALKLQQELLRRMRDQGDAPAEEIDRALGERLALKPASENFRAPHFCDMVLAGIPPAERRTLSVIRTTLDAGFQAKVEKLLAGHVAAMEKKGITNAAAVVLDNASGEILGLAGSRDFFDDRDDGQVNGVTALRQPGSTIKPFTYALALEKGMTAATILEDVPTQFATLEGNFAPENYDEKYHGSVRLRSALASSYNIPAVSVLQTIGPDLLYRRLKDLEFDSLRQPADFYGVGLTLGNGEIALLELARAYAAFARGGLYLRDVSILALRRKDGTTAAPPPAPRARRIFSPAVAYLITNILADGDARVPTFGYNSPLNFTFPAAAKTGTSKDFRDNWTVGYTPRYTVGVWAGNFDGRPMENVSGISGAGPLFRDILLLLNEGRKQPFVEPPGLVHAPVCPESGLRPSTRCPNSINEIFIAGTEPSALCRLPHRKSATTGSSAMTGSYATTGLPIVRGPSVPKSALTIVVPQDGDIFKLDPILRRSYQTLNLQVRLAEGTDVRTIEWWINGRKVAAVGPPFRFSWNLAPGSYTIRARGLAAGGVLESPTVKVQVLS
jgi:penicillin-binding protein 1C